MDGNSSIAEILIKVFKIGYRLAEGHNPESLNDFFILNEKLEILACLHIDSVIQSLKVDLEDCFISGGMSNAELQTGLENCASVSHYLIKKLENLRNG
ncbi:MAG: hypothetical protein KDK36_02210 [Leptospiraceae bacterium]|nr:hypothetical protein [Leptospiraceae bacterium]